jgi:thiamine pyrophosphate-dependent acetolactate synthase large subunit-like protein
MLDVIRSLGIEYCAANPGSSFRGLHESILNYAGNKNPELLTCLHEESSAAMAHGYAKIEGKPMMIMVHGTVGLQHASMAIYNAYCDRVPIFIVAGNILDVNYRRGNAEWVHSVQDVRWCGTTSSGMTIRSRLHTSPSRPFGLTKSP